jgi:hypothetical protein
MCDRARVEVEGTAHTPEVKVGWMGDDKVVGGELCLRYLMTVCCF